MESQENNVIGFKELDAVSPGYDIKIEFLWDFFKHTENFFEEFEGNKLRNMEEQMIDNIGVSNNMSIESYNINKLYGKILSNPMYLIAIMFILIFSLK